MSVLNQSGEEQVECPLCMEPLEVDDFNFFPCTCGYQICRFCWHRIRTDENGLCPACRKAYSENPADFTPLSKEQVAQLKAEKRQRDQQRKAKLSESRKHLASVRVVQRNLVFVVGLPMRLADAEVLKRHEYFGKFGKIHKVVINQSPQYAGTQGPSASAYVTYMKSDDALRAIQNVNNITLDGRLIKSSLGTTKYCSHFMKNQLCPKPDCMYLHDFGDPEASFTKEQMHAGKHQEYEKKLHEALLSKMAAQAAAQAQNNNAAETKSKKEATANKEKTEVVVGTKTKTKNGNNNNKKSITNNNNNNNVEKKLEKGKSCESVCQKQPTEAKKEDNNEPEPATPSPPPPPLESTPKLPVLDDNSSFFSQNAFQKLAPESAGEGDSLHNGSPAGQVGQQQSAATAVLSESLLDVNSTEDWEAAFGFTKHSNHLEELAKQRNNIKDTLETFGNGAVHASRSYEHSFGPMENYDITKNILGVLASKNGISGQNLHYKQHAPHQQPDERYATAPDPNSPPPPPQLTRQQQQQTRLRTTQLGHTKEPNGLTNGVNGLDQHQMSKFFTDLCSRNGTKEMFPNNGYLQKLEHENYLITQRRRQIEEQLLNLNLKQQQHGYGGVNGGVSYENGAAGNYTHQHGPVYQHHGEDELDFDPFQETQKALAELMEHEHKVHGSVRTTSSSGSLVNGGQLPPPPPGFVQPNAHMNSFGSKILPYLNMGSSCSQPQQQLGSNVTQSSWPPSFSQIQQHKAMGTCNDWKVLDPAIVSSSRHFPLANYTTSQPQPQHQQQQRSYDYTNTFSIQPNMNSFAQQNLSSWLGSDLNTKISSPPGFRSANHQSTKQQEC